MGHRHFKTTLIDADYQPRDDEVEFVDRAVEPSLKPPSSPRVAPR
jgi:hypothetical protein